MTQKTYYAVCDCVDEWKHEIRYNYEEERYLIYENVLDALIEANDVNLNRPRPICVVQEVKLVDDVFSCLACAKK